MSVDSDKRSCVLSAYCTCKGGIDGCCRHVLATLYEVIDFRNDEHRESVTSGPCLWVRFQPAYRHRYIKQE
ncbi:hypothetical protein V1264_016686 [Littorina saxatilis]|uniref:SWIM-type domain-containing protein n=1 Tax=Littorina saxatilis TaxID=31220 RepID=A0AAN9BH03_9CAEN